MADELTRKDDMGGGYEEADAPDDLNDEAGEMPHGAHALHDAHDFLSAGGEALGGHLKLADNPAVKELLADIADQFAAIQEEIRSVFEAEYPEHPAPEGGMETESEMPAEEEEEEEGMEKKSETALRDTPEKTNPNAGRPGVKGEAGGDRVETEEKSRTRRSFTSRRAASASAVSRKSYDPLERTRERKYERLLQLVEDLTAE